MLLNIGSDNERKDSHAPVKRIAPNSIIRHAARPGKTHPRIKKSIPNQARTLIIDQYPQKNTNSTPTGSTP